MARWETFVSFCKLAVGWLVLQAVDHVTPRNTHIAIAFIYIEVLHKSVMGCHSCAIFISYAPMPFLWFPCRCVPMQPMRYSFTHAGLCTSHQLNPRAQVKNEHCDEQGEAVSEA